MKNIKTNKQTKNPETDYHLLVSGENFWNYILDQMSSSTSVIMYNKQWSQIVKTRLKRPTLRKAIVRRDGGHVFSKYPQTVYYSVGNQQFLPKCGTDNKLPIKSHGPTFVE